MPVSRIRLAPAPQPLLGESSWARSVRHDIERCAPHTSTVLVSGPTGTGKELVARAIHRQSPRAENRFIPVDCTAITGTLFASQLFGHRKGAFTGAEGESLGCFRAAHEGTIFLDELGELTFDLQAKLLRVLQERVVVPVGGHDGIAVDVRVIAATNRDLRAEVIAGNFREDLFFRLNVLQIKTLGLKHRPDDIPVLATQWLQKLVDRSGFPHKTLSPGALEMLATFDWPGNVRQLQHLLERAVIACDAEIIALPLVQQLLDEARMPPNDRGTVQRDDAETNSIQSAMTPLAHDSGRGPAVSKAELAGGEGASYARKGTTAPFLPLQALERDHIRAVLEHTYYNQSATARLLGISRNALIRKLKSHGLELPARATRQPPQAR